MALELDEGEARQAERIISCQLARYRDSPDYEDMVQEARVSVWLTLNRVESLPCPLPQLVSHQARWAAQTYLRSSRAAVPYYRRHPERAGSIMSLEDLEWEPAAPSFEDASVERLLACQLWKELERLCLPREYRCLQAFYAREESQERIAAREGLTTNRVSQIIASGIDRYRKHYGLPLLRKANGKRKRTGKKKE